LVSFLIISAHGIEVSRGAAQPDTARLQQIDKAWDALRKRAHAGRFEWSEERTYMAGTLLSRSRNAASANRSSNLSPPTDKTVQVLVSVAFDGSLVRYSVNGPTWNTEHADFFEGLYVSANNEHDSKSLYGKSAPAGLGSHPVGFVHKLGGNWDSGTPCLQAVFIGLHGGSLGGFALSRQEGMIGTHRCIILTSRKEDDAQSEAKEQTEYWVDPEREFALLRVSRTYASDPTYQLDVSYQFDKTYRWVPESWTGIVLRRNPGKMQLMFHAVVSKYELGIAIPHSEFELDFPVGTEVMDRKRDSHYIVCSGGTERIVTKSEARAGVPYDELLVTESGKAGSEGRSRSGIRAFGMLATTVFLVGVALVILVRAIRHRSRRVMGL
jgi:hypothetical protein